MYFFRVQNSNFLGMYRSSDEVRSFAATNIQCVSDHPMPFDDDLLGESIDKTDNFKDKLWSSFIFGFDGLKQLKKWIYHDWWMEGLYEEGQAVYLYDVPEDLMAAGDTLAVICINWFSLNKEKFIKRFELKDLC